MHNAEYHLGTGRLLGATSCRHCSCVCYHLWLTLCGVCAVYNLYTYEMRCEEAVS